MAPDKVTVGLIQTSSHEDPRSNLEKNIAKIREAASSGAQIICLQELFYLPYFCQECRRQYFSFAETLPGPVTDTLAEVARELSVVIIAPLFERRAEGVYHNSAAVLDADGSLRGIYRKMHLPNDPFFYEKFYFAPGDLGWKCFDTRYGRIGVLICWDQWFPEAARLVALEGAQVLFYPTAIGWHELENKEEAVIQREAWEVVQRSHAIANEIYVAAVNRTGKEGPVTFWGSSFVCDPFGKMLAKAEQTGDAILLAECDLSRIAEIRQNWPFLRDRRIDAYRGMDKIFGGAGEALP